MASPTYALHRIRRNIRKQTDVPPKPPTKAFDEQRAEYRELFEEVHVLGGDLALDDLTDWIVHRTTETGNIPDVSTVREQARRICTEYEVGIPAESPLHD